MLFDKKLTEKFVYDWNEANGFSQGVSSDPNMRTEVNGVVYWNIYDGPEFDLNYFLKWLSQHVRSLPLASFTEVNKKSCEQQDITNFKRFPLNDSTSPEIWDEEKRKALEKWAKGSLENLERKEKEIYMSYNAKQLREIADALDVKEAQEKAAKKVDKFVQDRTDFESKSKDELIKVLDAFRNSLKGCEEAEGFAHYVAEVLNVDITCGAYD